MPRIRILPDHLISQIAAGEVVERPASVVKELVENAVDAGAGRVDVELEVGGKRRIRVVDDGCGMAKDDALLAFDRHATSKIAAFEDLEAVSTLGFRGEALATVAAVARVEMVTAADPGDGWRVRIEGGRVRAVEPAARARGTTLEVGSLFFNVPARRKFLKSPATELRRCAEVVQGYALARPDLGFSLRHEGRALLDLAPSPDGVEGHRHRIGEVFGHELAERLVPIPAPRGPASGFLGRPDSARARRTFVFVNGRLIRDRQVLAVFYRAVRETWRNDDFPSLFLFLEVTPEDLDVNVHPQKAEVRFRDSSYLDGVREALVGGLRAIRGEAGAPLRHPLEAPSRPFAGHGLGATSFGPWGLHPETDPGPPGSVAEGESASDAWRGPSAATVGTKIAEITVQPRAPVPLSGPRGAERSLRYLGQYKGSLLLVEAPGALLLIDQHAAHERVLYEEISRALAAKVPPVQRLLVPHLIELAPAEAMRLAELAPGLRELGFGLEELSGRDFALAAVPAPLGDEEAVDLLTALAARSEGRPADLRELRDELLLAVAATQACRSAIKIHHPLPVGQVEELVGRLFACDDPWACPHGRPTVLEMGDAELERRFGRR